ncbi:hypothetical protein OEZ85_005648 [Tetradesmus obliquus]|uniref:Protein kinase domain-containing protein n=1 Tax=Tetradesmus obliquus TaxID=3088 RepID=A0ABY8UEM3_TETOB|nr:hypothetical protein OEZ85_005648 [Tetradesmus obliquus]
MLTEANLLRCVTPDDNNNCYNSHVIFVPDLQPTGSAAATPHGFIADAAAAPPSAMRHLHSSAASSTSSSAQLRGVNAALFGLQVSEQDARGMPAVVIGTLTRAQAAAIKFGGLVSCNSYSRLFCAKLGHHDVAVRVINHSGTSLEQVSAMLQEILVMQHPHVLKSHAFVTWAVPCAPDAPSSPHPAASTIRSSASGTGNKDKDSASGNDAEGEAAAPAAAADGVRRRLGGNQLETWVVEEFCHAGTLQQAVQRGGMQRFVEDDVPQMGPLLEQLLGVARGMEYLHSADWIAGDLRASNVLLTHAQRQQAAAGAAPFSPASRAMSCSGSLPCSPQALHTPLLQRAGSLGRTAAQLLQQAQQGMSRDDSAGAVTMRLVPKISEFGLGRVINEGATHLSTHTLGALSCQAPEVMRSGVLSKQGDVYAFGMLMWEVIMGCEPWKNKCMGDIINLILVEQARPKFTAKVPKGYARLAASCWQQRAADRPTFEQLVLLLKQMKSETQSLQMEANAACGSYMGFF